MTKLKSLRNHQNFMKYFKNTSWLVLEKIVRLTVGFFVLILLTRYLGPENFGILAYSQSFVAIFAAFATLGLDIILVREIVKNKKNKNKLIGTAFYLKVIASIVSLLTILIINFFIGNDDNSMFITNIIAFSLIFQSFNVIDTYFQTYVISKYVVFANTTSFLISSSIKFFLIYYEYDLSYFAYALVFDSFVIALGYLYIYMNQKQSIFIWRFDADIAKYFLNNAWPLVLVTLSAFIYTRIDQVMIKHMIGNEAVGNYAAAIRVSELFLFIPGLIAQSIFPKIIDSKGNSMNEYYRLLEVLYKIVVWVAIPISLIIFYFSDNIVGLLYGSQYTQAGAILMVLSFSIFFNSVGAVSEKILYAEHYERKYLHRTILGMLLNIILNLILINIYGALGASIATLLTLVFIHYIYDLLDKDLRKFYYMKWKCFIPIQNTKKDEKLNV